VTRKTGFTKSWDKAIRETKFRKQPASEPDSLTPMYRYSDRDAQGEMAPAGASQRVLLEVINVVQVTKTGWSILEGGGEVNPEFMEQYAPTLKEARLKFLKLKMEELRECQREQELIVMSIDEMLVSQPGET